MESPREAGLAEALDLADRGDPAAATALAFRLIAAGPEWEPPWLLAGELLCLQGCREEFFALADQFQHHRGRGAILFKEVMTRLLGRGRLALVQALAAAVPADRPWAVLAPYFQGCALVAAGEHRQALAAFARFKQAVPRSQRLLPFRSDPFLNVILRQGCLVEDAPFVEALAGRPEQPLDWVWHGPPPAAPPAGPMLVSAANGLYFDQFAEGLVRSAAALERGLTVHLHLIDGGPDSLARLPALAALVPAGQLQVSLSRAGARAGATYFACARFLLAPGLLAACRAPLWLTDIDALLKPGFGRLLEALAAAANSGPDLACFDTGRCEPASRFAAGVVRVADTDGARRLLERIGRFILAKLDRPLADTWMLDQAALYSVVAWAQQALPDIRFADLGRLAGGLGLEDVLESLHPGALKNAMRWSVESRGQDG
jgi:hypothetical protein